MPLKMQHAHERKIKKNFKRLKQDMDAKDLIDTFIEEELFDFRDMERINGYNPNTQDSRNNAFFPILFQCGPRAYEVFLKALREQDLGFLAELVEQTKLTGDNQNTDQSVPRLPFQSLSQMNIPYISDTPARSQAGRSQHHATHGLSSRHTGQSGTPSTATRRTRSPSPGPRTTKTRSPSPPPTKKAQKSRSPSPPPAKKAHTYRSPAPTKKAQKTRSPSPPPAKKAQKTRTPSPVPRRGRNRSPVPQRQESQNDKSPLVPIVAVKTEPVSQTDSARAVRKRARNIIDDEDSDDETERPATSKRVRAEPATPQIKPAPFTSRAAPAHTEAFGWNDDDIDYSKIEASMSPRHSSRPSRASPSRRSKSRSPSPRPSKTAAKSKIKTEAERDPVPRVVEATTKPANEETIYARVQGSNKRQVVDEKYENSVVPVEDTEDRKLPAISAKVPTGFLSTRKPIEDQIQRNRDYKVETDLPSRCVNIDVVSLVARQPRPMATTNRGCPDGHTRWKGKVVKNFKKFRKTSHCGSQALPTIIGGSDLEVHTGQRSKEMDTWFKEAEQAESQATSEERRAQELFDGDPSSRRRGR